MKVFKQGIAACALVVFVLTAGIRADEKAIEKRPAEKNPTSDQDFIVKAVAGDLVEIKLAERTIKQTSNKDVEKFARRMRDDHSKCRDALLERARDVKLAVLEGLDKEHQEKIDRLSKIEGSQYDRAYMRCMVEGHEHMLHMYEFWADKAKDRDLAAHIKRTIPTIKQHLEDARDISNKLKS